MKLYAIYKDGKLAKRGILWDGFVHKTKYAAWHASNFTDNAAIQRNRDIVATSQKPERCVRQVLKQVRKIRGKA